MSQDSKNWLDLYRQHDLAGWSMAARMGIVDDASYLRLEHVLEPAVRIALGRWRYTALAGGAITAQNILGTLAWAPPWLLQTLVLDLAALQYPLSMPLAKRLIQKAQVEWVDDLRDVREQAKRFRAGKINQIEQQQLAAALMQATTRTEQVWHALARHPGVCPVRSCRFCCNGQSQQASQSAPRIEQHWPRRFAKTLKGDWLTSVGMVSESSYLLLEPRLSEQDRIRVGQLRYRAHHRRDQPNDSILDRLMLAPPWLLQTRLDAFGFTKGLANVMRQQNLRFVADLIGQGTQRLIRTPNLGKLSLRELEDTLEEALCFGVRFPGGLTGCIPQEPSLHRLAA